MTGLSSLRVPSQRPQQQQQKMAQLNEQDAAILRGLVERMGAVEGVLGEVERRSQQNETEITRTNESANSLVAALRTEFNRLQAQMLEVQRELADLREAVDEIKAGRVGAAGNALLDARLLEKPGKFSGDQKDWKDWSESVQAFCDVADVALGAAMKRYAKATESVPFEAMTESDQQQARKLWYLLILLCKGDAAHKRRSSPEKHNGLEPGEPSLRSGNLNARTGLAISCCRC